MRSSAAARTGRRAPRAARLSGGGYSTTPPARPLDDSRRTAARADTAAVAPVEATALSKLGAVWRHRGRRGHLHRFLRGPCRARRRVWQRRVRIEGLQQAASVVIIEIAAEISAEIATEIATEIAAV